jgi:DNA invertase Pin-like site-specific DNA recombinase
MTTTNPQLPFDAYLRVSDKDGREGDSYHSPTDQLDDIVARAPSFGIAHIGEHVLEEDVSGKTAAEDRRLERLIRRIENGQSGGIVTARLDRFGRNLIHGSLALKRIIEADGRLVCVNDGIDSDAPGSKLNIQMRLAIAEEYLDQQTRGFNRSSGGAVKAGKHVGAHVPAGYTKGEDGRLTPNGDADAIREAFERRARGDSFQSIAAFLTVSGVKPGGSKNNGWSRSGVQTLIANRTYLGEVRGQRRLDDKLRPHEQFVNPKAHKALVSPELFAAANARKGQRAARNGKLAGTGILGGLITCEACGHKLRRKSSANGPVYACARYYGETPCPAPATATVRLVDDYVRQALDQVIANGEVEETMDNVRRRASAEQAVRDAQRELDGLADLTLRRSVGAERHTAMTAEAAQRLQIAQAELHEIETDGDEEVVAPDSELFTGEHWTTERQRKLARSFIAEVTLAKGRTPARERVEIRWAGQDEFDADLLDRIEGVWYADLSPPRWMTSTNSRSWRRRRSLPRRSRTA